MDIDSYAWDERGALMLRGHLSGPAHSLYRAIRDRCEALGFTPFLRRAGEQDELLAVPGVIERTEPRVVLPVVLFGLTVLTVLLTGAFYENGELFLRPGLLLQNPALLLAGVPFAATLLGILFTHEMGHYVVGKLRKAPVSLPYFIPMPPYISITGTMGAVIVQREPMEDRKSVLEIGIAGPLAGLAVAIPLLFYGLATSKMGPPPAGGYMQEGNSLLYAGMKYIVFGQFLPSNGLDVQLNSVGWGAWIGLLVTMLNMLPVGQLDGGHVAYALLGRRADIIAYGMIALCLALGVFVSSTWLIWAVLIFLIGPRHPAPLNDVSPLDTKHKVLAVFGLIVFVLLFMPDPLRVVEGI
jgi:membrane-associated protease RseP (regulator of RpoE activity)